MDPSLQYALLYSYGSHFDQARLLLVNLNAALDAAVFSLGVSRYCKTNEVTKAFRIELG